MNEGPPIEKKPETRTSRDVVSNDHDLRLRLPHTRMRTGVVANEYECARESTNGLVRRIPFLEICRIRYGGRSYDWRHVWATVSKTRVRMPLTFESYFATNLIGFL